MPMIATRTIVSKLLREWNVFRPFTMYQSHRKISTESESESEFNKESTTQSEYNEKLLAQDEPDVERSTQSEHNISNIKSKEGMINPLHHPDFFQIHNLFTVKDLFDARVHFGHKVGSLDPYMKPYIFGSRLGHLIIDLDQTADLLRQALNFAAHVAFRDGIILFITRNPQVAHLVEKTAKECEEFSHTRHWRQGTFTDSLNVFKAVTRLPDLCIFLNTMDTVVDQHVAVEHAAKMSIPTIGIVDTNCDPRLITYPVPGNDDSMSSHTLYCSLFKEAIMRGKNARKLLMKSVESDMS